MFTAPATSQLSLLLTLLCAVVATAQVPPAGDNFVLVNELFAGESETPYSVHRVVFRQTASGLVCFDREQSSESEATIFDFTTGQMYLIDRQARAATTVGMQSAIEATARFDAETTDVDARERLGIDSVVRQAPAARLTTRFGEVTYDVQTRPGSGSGEASQIGQFVDAACRLNFLQGLGLPPFARLRLNTKIVRDGQVAIVTEVTLKTSGETIRMQTRRLPATPADLAWTDQLASLRAVYRDLPMAQFLKLANSDIEGVH